MTKLILLALILFFNTLFNLALLTYAFFWYETANSDYRTELDEMSKGKTGRWIFKGILSSFFSLMLVVFFYPLRFRKKLWHPQGDPDSILPPVVLVHGLYHNASAWVFYRRWLKRAGYTNIYAVDYGSLRPSFEEALGKLGALIGEVMEQFPGQQIVLVGHSLGGLLCRAYANDAENVSKVSAVITLGSPHQGTKLAALGLGRLARSLIYRGALIEEIEQSAANSAIPGLAIFSPIDNMIHPNVALKANQAGWTYQQSRPISHTAMLYHRHTAHLLLDYLENISRVGSQQG